MVKICNRKFSLRSFSILSAFGAALFLQSCSTPCDLADARNAAKAGPQFLNNVDLDNNHANTVSLSTKSVAKNRFSIDPSATNAMQEKYAGMMGVFANSLTNLSLYSFIDNWMGVRYRLGGTTKSGIDCSAFVRTLYSSVFCTDLLRTAAEQFTMANVIFDKDQLKEGDLVFFRIHSSRISHVGIYLTNNHFVHASCSKGITISSLDETYWSRYYAAGGRIM